MQRLDSDAQYWNNTSKGSGKPNKVDKDRRSVSRDNLGLGRSLKTAVSDMRRGFKGADDEADDK